MSKFERYRKQIEEDIYPHKHCKRCGEMIEEAYTYCSDCYDKLKQKKEKKWYKRLRRSKKPEELS